MEKTFDIEVAERDSIEMEMVEDIAKKNKDVDDDGRPRRTEMETVEDIVKKNQDVDDDGRPRRTGTLWTATAHIITAVIGSGVLSLGWANAQLGWVAGSVALIVFSAITWFTSILLADCYRYPDPITGTRNHSYMEVVKANLGGTQVLLCGIAQYTNLVGVCIGYTITGSISMAAVKRSSCFHAKGHDGNVKCKVSDYLYMSIFGLLQIALSQLPSIHKLEGLSIVAAIMSFTYSSIGIGLSIAKIAGGGNARTTLTGVSIGRDVSEAWKVWRIFQALGNIAFAYTFSNILVEIQDTLKSSPPENKVMKKASGMGVSTTTVFYMLCGCLGYAAFGNDAPGNFLTGFGFYEPFWLIDIGNICIAIHLIGAYQVFCQPWYQFVEDRCIRRWPKSNFLTKEFHINIFGLSDSFTFTFFRLTWRTIFVVFTMVVAMIFPFFNDFVGLLGAVAFWPLSVHFPIEMHITRRKTPRCSAEWVGLRLLSLCCLMVSAVAAIGCIRGLISGVQKFEPFH